MRLRWMLAAAVLLSACGFASGSVETVASTAPGDTAAPTTLITTPHPRVTSTTTVTTTTTIPTMTVTGTVTAPDGSPLPGVSIAAGDTSTMTGPDGRFTLAGIQPGLLTIARPAWIAQEVQAQPTLTVTLEPFVVRGIRVSRYKSMEPTGLAELLDLIDGTTVNTLVFDTKDETGGVLYRTEVPKAVEIGVVEDVYDPAAAIAEAREAGLYTITRIVTFEDPIWSRADAEAKLAGRWIDPRNPDNWEYPLGLAVEACELGFDEIQFDYVRFPAGLTASAAPPTSQEERLTAIAAFLAEARDRLHPLGCAVSADVFGIVTSSPTDEGIGQRPEEISAVVDALSPMVYPSHYSPGWLGLADPNDHPATVTADALDGAAPRMAPGTLLRPWLQAFYYNGSQVQAAIAEAEARGHGWMLWNAGGNYGESWLPPAGDG